MFKVNLEEINLEVLHDIPKYSRYAACLKTGRIWNKEKQRWVIANPNELDYCNASVLDDDGNRRSVGVHVLIMRAAFAIGSGHHFNWEGLNLEVDHLDFDRSNNFAGNLVIEHIAINRARREMAKNKKRLDKKVIAKLREEYKELKHGEKIKWFRVKGEEYGVSYRCIQDNCLGYINKDVV